MQENCPTTSSFDLGATFGVWILRLWLGFRALLSGIEKYSGNLAANSSIKVDGVENSYGLTTSSSQKMYSLDFYHGIPVALKEKFASEPLIPQAMLPLFDTLLGPLFILTGITLLLGVASRCSLLIMGLLYTSLSFGLILLNQSSGVAWLGTHVLLVVLMLFTAKYNRLELTGRWKI